VEDRKAAELRWIEEADECERSAQCLPTLGELLRSLETQPIAPYRGSGGPRTGILGASMPVSWSRSQSGLRRWRMSRPSGATLDVAARRRSRHSAKGLG
jgi:hypothetical protein